MDCSLFDEVTLETQLDVMVDRFKSWMDDVEHKIKDVLDTKKKKQDAEEPTKSQVDRSNSTSPLEQEEVESVSPVRSAKSTSPVKSDKSASPVQEDNSANPVQEDKSASPVQEDKSSSPVLENKSASPVLEDKSASPVQEDKSASPLLENKSASPVQEDKSAIPVQEDKSASPVQEDKSSSPVQEDKSSRPVLEDKSASPVLEDKSASPIQEEKSASTVQEDKSASPVLEDKSASPVLEDKSASPVQEDKSASPVQEDKSASPVQEDKSSSPVLENKSASPVQEDKSAIPVQEDKSASPVQEDKSSSPVQEDKSSRPVLEDKSSSPVQEDKSASPVQEDKLASPVREDKSASPVQEDKSASPAQEDKSASPVREVSPGPGTKDTENQPLSTSSSQHITPSSEKASSSEPFSAEWTPYTAFFSSLGDTDTSHVSNSEKGGATVSPADSESKTQDLPNDSLRSIEKLDTPSNYTTKPLVEDTAVKIVIQNITDNKPSDLVLEEEIVSPDLLPDELLSEPFFFSSPDDILIYSTRDPTLRPFTPIQPSSPDSGRRRSSITQQLLERSAEISKLLSNNLNTGQEKEECDQGGSDKLEVIRNLSKANSPCPENNLAATQAIPSSSSSHKLQLKDAESQTAWDHSSVSPSKIKPDKVINKEQDIYKRAPSSPHLTLLKTMSSPEQDSNLEKSTEKLVETQRSSTENILTNLSYVNDGGVTEVRQRRQPVKQASLDQAEDDVFNPLDEMDPSAFSRPMSTKHRLLDHSFSENTPDDNPNVAAKFIRQLRRNTSEILENHDAENDPSLTVEDLNAQAKLGNPVIPDIKCDIAIRISSKTTTEVLEWFIGQLSWTGLIVTSNKGCSGDHFIKVTADKHTLLKGAESMELLKRIHPARGDGMKPFNRNEVSLFCPRQSTDGFLSASERQLILYDAVTKIRTEVPTTIGNIKFYQHESVVSGLISNNVIKQIYPLHQKSKQAVLNRLWVWNPVGEQPLSLIRHYFGDEIALYFAWLGSYTTVLIVPLIVGLLIWLYGYDDDDVISADRCFTFYAFFNVVWPTIFLELWKRRSAGLAWEWGTLGRDLETQETQRPQFKGTLGANPVTGEMELQYSALLRQAKQAVSLVVSSCCLLVVLISMLAVFRFDDYVQHICSNEAFPDFVPGFLTRFVRYTPKVLLPITVGILDALYSNIAVTLNDWENYKHQRTYENWLVLKLILFKFVNSFLALFYIAFYLQDFDKLQETLATLLITKQIVGNCGEILGPTLTSWAKVYLLRRSSGGREECQSKLTQVETESEKPRYDSSFDDYLEMFIQMGYVILFSAAYPMAAIWAFLNNIVEIRGDAFKMVNGLQRPFMKRVEDIGFWQDAFEILSVIAIVVNCSLIGIRGQVGRWFPSFTTGQQIVFVIIMEHVFLSIKFIIDRAIPDVPAWVQLASAKERYKRNRALKGLSTIMRTARLKGQLQKKAKQAKSRVENKNNSAVKENGAGEQIGTEQQSSRYKLE